MKKIVLSLTLFLALFSCSNLQAQDNSDITVLKYYYYPSQNVYYNEVTNEYWYYDKPTVKWVSVKTLPTEFTVDEKANKSEFTYKGLDVWRDNKKHITKYREKKNGKIKMQVKDN